MTTKKTTLIDGKSKFPWLPISLLVLFSFGAAFVVWNHQRGIDKTESQYKPLGYAGLSFNPSEVEQARLESESRRAVHIITLYGPWEREGIESALAGWKVTVSHEPQLRSAGRLVDSYVEPVTRQVVVTRDLYGLAHEFIHVVELATEGIDDGDHEKWQARGLKRADEEFAKAIRP